MGYICHHTIVITGPKFKMEKDEFPFNISIEDVHKTVKSLAPSITSEIISGVTNDFHSFFIAPDGSKEGWSISDDYENIRKKIIEYLESLRYADGSTSFSYAEIQFGDDNGNDFLISSNRIPRIKV